MPGVHPGDLGPRQGTQAARTDVVQGPGELCRGAAVDAVPYRCQPRAQPQVESPGEVDNHRWAEPARHQGGPPLKWLAP
jgi:hypothetical protein